MNTPSRLHALFGAVSAVSLLCAAPALAQVDPQTAPAPTAPGQATTSGGASNTVGAATHRVPGAGPTGQTAPAADADAAIATQDATGPDIVVLGVRGAQRAAINIKRTAPQIVDSIVAEDIGKLPDTTIADSLQRVPGVQITRDAGEGAGVNIRGIPQVLTTLNGELFLDAGAPTQQGGQSTAGSSIAQAQPNFGDVPPSLFAGVDVIKSPTADELSGGISGILALKTRRPLDLQRGLTGTLSAQGDYGFRTDSANQSYNGLLSYNANDKFGALIAFAYTKETLANYNPNTSYSFDQPTDQDVGFDLRKDGVIGNSTALTSKDFYYQPIYYGLNNQTTERERTGINGSFQYKFGGGFTATADVAYLHLNQRDRVEEAEVVFHSKLNVLQPGASIAPDGALLNGTFNLPTDGDGFLQDHSFSGLTTSDATNVSLALDYNNGGRLRGSLRYVGAVAQQSFSSADVDSLGVQRTPITLPSGQVVNADPNGLSNVQVGVSTTGDSLGVTFPAAVGDPQYYNAQSTWANGNRTDANFNVVRGDAAYDTDWGPLKTLEIGARYGERIVKFNAYKEEEPEGGTDSSHLYYYNDSLIPDPNSPIGATIIPLKPFPSLGNLVVQAHDFGPITGIPASGLPFIDPKAMDNNTAFEQSLFGSAPIAYTDPTASYRVTEKETSGYVQADFRGDRFPLIGLSYSGNIGVRLVNTEITIRNFATNSNDFIGAGGSYNGVLLVQGVNESTNSYFDPLPEFNISFDVTDTQKFRLAYNRAVARQDLSTLAQGYVASYEANGTKNPSLPSSAQLFLQASSGNPNLDPFRANIVQGSYEWYFHRASLLSLAAFYVDVDSFPVAATLDETGPMQADADGVVRAGGPVTTTINGGGGSIKGIELGYQQVFDFLPGWLSGFGAQANYTYSSSDTDNKDVFGDTLPIPNNSTHQVNGVLFYQKGPLQGRVAYNWRSEQYQSAFQVGGQNIGIYVAPVGFLDASVSYDLNPRLTIFAQGTNLTQSGYDRYLKFSDLYYNQNIFEARVFFGVRLRL
ncbi:MAG: TonB-dependent receptor [Caulobacteraceae bacterium]|nr:TonB-dependent receptor [Caulobacter sp.]